MDSSGGEVIMGYLAGLAPVPFSDLAAALAADLRLHNHRLILLILSPPHFSTTITFLTSLSLPQKLLLLARLLLRSLNLLLSPSTTTTRSSVRPLRLLELDAALLLLAMCECYDSDDDHFDWRAKIARQVLRGTLSSSGLGGGHVWPVVARYVDSAAKCRRLLDAVAAAKTEREIGASAAAVVALESVEPCGGGGCAICTEGMEEFGREVCRMPCGHLFHWMCVLPWLRKKNTCPVCRFELPTDDVFGEVRRLWGLAARLSAAEAAGGAAS